MPDLHRLREITPFLSYQVQPVDTLKGVSQAGLNKQQLLRIDGKPIDCLSTRMFDFSENKALRQALGQMSFNKARLIQKDLASLMIALDPPGTLRKAIREGFVISGLQDGPAITTHFTQYMPLAMAETGVLGQESFDALIGLYVELPFRVSMHARNSSPKTFVDYLVRELPKEEAPLRIRLSDYSKDTKVVGELVSEILNREADFPYEKLIWDYFEGKSLGIERGTAFDKFQCQDIVTLGGKISREEDFCWKNRLNLDLVDDDEKLTLLVNLIENFPGISASACVFRNAMIQSPAETLPRLKNLTANQQAVLVDLKLLEKTHLKWLSATARTHVLGADLGL